MPGCLADGRVLIFPSTGWDWRNLTHASPAGSFTRPFSRRQYLSKLTNRIESRLSLFFLKTGALAASFYQSSASTRRASL